MKALSLAVVIVAVASCGLAGTTTTADVTTSSTSALVEVPDLVGEEEAFARGVLIGIGLQVEVTTAPSSGQPGSVVAQVPPAGERVAGNSIVRLVVSEQETVTTKAATSTTEAQVDHADIVASLRRISEEIGKATGSPTWVDLVTDAQIVNGMEMFCSTITAAGVNATVAAGLEHLQEWAEDGNGYWARGQLTMYMAMWAAAVNNYCPEHASEYFSIANQIREELETAN